MLSNPCVCEKSFICFYASVLSIFPVTCFLYEFKYVPKPKCICLLNEVRELEMIFITSKIYCTILYLDKSALVAWRSVINTYVDQNVNSPIVGDYLNNNHRQYSLGSEINFTYSSNTQVDLITPLINLDRIKHYKRQCK